MECDKGFEDMVGNGASFVVVHVDTKVDGTSDDLAAQTEAEPETQKATLIVRFRIGKGDSCLDRPEDTSRETAKCCAEKNKPAITITIVDV